MDDATRFLKAPEGYFVRVMELNKDGVGLENAMRVNCLPDVRKLLEHEIKLFGGGPRWVPAAQWLIDHAIGDKVVEHVVVDGGTDAMGDMLATCYIQLNDARTIEYRMLFDQ